jgi:hypothetical protein
MVLLLSPLNTEKVLKKSGVSLNLGDINGLFLNIRFEKESLNLITGISTKNFIMDKTLEHTWDDDLKLFLKHYEIAVEEE